MTRRALYWLILIMPRIPRSRITERVPLGVLVILVLAVCSSVYVLLRREAPKEGLEMWTFINVRVPIYEGIINELGLEGQERVHVELVEYSALRRRLLSGFFSGTPLPDILELERGIAALSWRGPLDAVGFVDLTERLREEGLMEKINGPSFSPWTNRGRIFGLPEDVHPTLLMYRADIFEAAGINVAELDTWEKFFAETARLAGDLDGDGTADRRIFELSERDASIVEALVLQAGGHLIDLDGNPSLDDPLNVRVLAQIAHWASGDVQLTGDVDLYSGAGHRLRSDGFVLAWLAPDWRSRRIEIYSADLAGKVKLMPLPAWEEGGRRTSAWGGTMLGFPRTSDNFEESWKFVKRLFLSRDLAIRSWEEFSVLTPVKDFWDEPVFREPNPFYAGQESGRMYIEQADSVPLRSSSPYLVAARQELLNAFSSLVRWARRDDVKDMDQLEAKAAEVLGVAQSSLKRQMDRNRFLTTKERSSGP